MPKARRKDGVRRALRADLVLGSKPQSLARAKVVASEGHGAKNVELAAGKQEPTAKRHAAPAGVEAARKRRATKRDRFLDKLRESKRELEVVKAVRSHGEALGNVSSLSEALTNSLSEIEALKPRAGSSKNKSRRQSGHQEEDEEGNAGTGSRKRLRNRARKQIQLAEVSLFKQVLNHPSMAQNPVAAVQEHLRQRLENESA